MGLPARTPEAVTEASPFGSTGVGRRVGTIGLADVPCSSFRAISSGETAGTIGLAGFVVLFVGAVVLLMGIFLVVGIETSWTSLVWF